MGIVRFSGRAVKRRICRACGLPLGPFHRPEHDFCRQCWSLTRFRHAVEEFSRAEQLPLDLPSGGRGERWTR